MHKYPPGWIAQGQTYSMGIKMCNNELHAPCLGPQTIKKIDTVSYYVFLSSGFAALVSYVHNYPFNAGNDRCVVAGAEPD